MSKFLKEDGISYQDEKYKIVSDLIVEKQMDHLMNISDETNGDELSFRNMRMVEFTESFKEQLAETREYESKIIELEDKIENKDVYNVSLFLEETRELLSERDLEIYENRLEYIIENEFDEIKGDLEKDFEMQEELIKEELENHTIDSREEMLEYEPDEEIEVENEMTKELEQEVTHEDLEHELDRIEYELENEDEYER